LSLAAIETQVKGLEVYLKQFPISDEDREEYGKAVMFGECWEWKESEQVEY